MSIGEIDPSVLEGGLHADHGSNVISCVIVFVILCTTILALRFFSLNIGNRPICLEDWVMIPTWVLMMGLCVNVICSVKYGGVGRHEAWVLMYNPGAMVRWAQALFVTEFIYGILIPLEKTSILLLYLRLFRVHRSFRHITHCLLVYIWMWGISESIVAIFQCKPVAFQWNKSLEGTCINQLRFYRWINVPNVIHDVVMLTMPTPVVWKIQTGTRQKLALTGVFLVGSLGCVASFIRMVLFFRLDAFSDTTWASIQLMSWTLAEPGVILICACMPALWPLVVRFTPSVTSWLRSKVSNGTRGSEGPGTQTPGARTWTGRSRNPVHGDADFIPLDSIEDHRASCEFTSTQGHGSQSQQGIKVTKEFSVVAQGN